MAAPWFKTNELPAPFLEWASSPLAGEFIVVSPVSLGAEFLVALQSQEGIDLLQGEAITAVQAAALYNPQTHEPIAGEEVFAWTPSSS